MRVFVLVLFLILPILARGATCPAGQYLENDECIDCNPNNEPFYCPGDDLRYDCPKTNTDYNALAYPDTVSFGPEANWAIYHNTKSSGCFGDIHFETPDGDRYLLECPYNGENYYCADKWWHLAGVGKYLSGYILSNASYSYYSNIKPCTNEHPTHSHYSDHGTPDEPVAGGKTDYNDCPWACDDGYGRHNDECLPLCTAGATKFHVGDYVFNIYANKLTTPAINIGLGDGSVCYVPLVAGAGKGALNVDYHGTVYHTSD